MKGIVEYISSGDAAGLVTEAEVGEVLSRWEWFSTARVVRSHLSGRMDVVTAAVSVYRAVSSLDKIGIDAGLLTALSADDIIERFLREGGRRIVAEDGGPEVEVDMAAELSAADDLASEELAEIYLAQGLRDEAIATYRKLSLLNSEKSVYFAKLIEKIETNNK